MSIYIDADVFVAWEKGRFDLPAWLEEHGDESFRFPATVWQQLSYGIYGWQEDRAVKRLRFLREISAGVTVAPFSRHHAVRAAQIAANLKHRPIGFADSQIAAMVLEDDAELLTFNSDHFSRVPGLRLATL